MVTDSERVKTSTGGAPEGALAAHCRRSALTVVLWQLFVTLALGAVAAIWFALNGQPGEVWRAAQSALAGGASCAVPSAYLARRMFKFPENAPPRVIVRAFYIGEVAKIGLSVVLLSLALVALDLHLPVFLLSYVAALSVYWFALLGTAKSAPGEFNHRGHR